MTFGDGKKITNVETVSQTTSGTIKAVAVGSIARFQVRWKSSDVDRGMNLTLNGTVIETLNIGELNINPIGDFIYMNQGDVLACSGETGGSGGVEYNIYIETFNKP